LLLDNPTANLDAETEAALLETIVRVRHGRTLVIATQQLAVGRYVDRLITLGDDPDADDRSLAHAGTTEKGQAGE
jgi:ATP-binding cassette subfamily B protein